MRNSSSLDWLRFMHTPNDYRVSPLYSSYIKWSKIEKGIGEGVDQDALNIAGKLQILFFLIFYLN